MLGRIQLGDGHRLSLQVADRPDPVGAEQLVTPGVDSGEDDDRRLGLITAELAKELQARGMYRVLDQAPAAQLIEKLRASYELRQCNGCEIDIGKALGAERIALCWVQKVSNLILNINVEVRNVATGDTVYAKSVDIRGNTDEAWLRGVRRLVDNIEERGHQLR